VILNHNLVLDFSEDTVQVYPKRTQLSSEHQQLRQIMNNTQNSKPHVGMVAAICTDSNVVSEECAIPDFGVPNTYELP